MRTWTGHGSEHSAGLAMIGHFKTEEDARKAQEIIELLSSELEGKVDVGTYNQRYDSEVMEILKKADCYILSPAEIEQFSYGIYTDQKDNKVTLTTDESDISAFLKLMISKGASVEVFSRHDHPDRDV